MVENSQDLALKLTQTQQDLMLAQTRVAALEAVLASGFTRTDKPEPPIDRRFQKLVESSREHIVLTNEQGEILYTNPVAPLLGYTTAEYAASELGAFLHPTDLPQMQACFQALRSAPNAAKTIEVRSRHQQGHYVWLEVTATNWLHDPDIGALVLRSRDITQRKQAEAIMRKSEEQEQQHQQTEAALQRYAQRMEILHNIDKGIIEAQSIQAVVTATLKHIRQVIPCQQAGAVLFDYTTNEVLIFAGDLQSTSALSTGQRYPMPPGFLEEFGTSTVTVINDIQLLPEASQAYQRVRKEGMRSALRALLMVQGRPTGVLALNADTPGYFTADHQEIAAEVANQIAIAIQQMQLADELARHAAELEQHMAEIQRTDAALRRSESLFQHSEERYRRVVEDQTDLIGRFQPDFKLTFVNRAYGEAFGKQPDELIGQSILGLIPQAYQEQVIAHLSALNPSRPIATSENPVQRADGTLRWFQWTNQITLDADGHTVEYQGVGRDITSQKKLQAEQQRHAQTVEDIRQFLESTLDAFSASTAVLASDGTIIKINAAWQHFWAKNDGIAAHSYLAENYLTVCDHATGEKSAEAAPTAAGIRAVIAGEQDDFYLEYSCHSPTEQRWFGLRVTPFAEAAPRRVVTAHINITERIQIEQAEREQRRFAEAMRDSVAALTTSRDVKIVMQQILNYALRVVPGEAGSIILFEGDQGRLAYLQGYTPEAMATLIDYQFPIESLFFGNMLVNRAPYFVPDTEAAPHWVTVPFNGWIRSSIGIPIELHAQIIGALIVDSATPHHFQPTDIEKLQAFARYASLALENAYHVTELEQRVLARTAELQTAKERVEGILNNSLDGILLVDSELRIQQTNSAFNTLVACGAGDDFAGSLRDLIHLDDMPSVSAVIQTVVKVRVGQQLEMRCYRKNGTLFDAELSIGYIQADSLVLTLRDITERKARERQLLFHASLQETVTDAVIATDLAFRIQSWNRAAENVYGWRSEEVLGRSIREVLQTELTSGKPIEQARLDFQAKGYWTDEVIHRHKTGHAIHIRSSTVLFKDEQGTAFGMVSVNHDITARKNAEQAMQAKIEEERTFQNYLKELHAITIELTQIDQLDAFYQQTIVLGRSRLGFDRLALFLYDAHEDAAVGTFGTDRAGQLSDERAIRFSPAPDNIMRRAFQATERFCIDGPASLFHNMEAVGVGWNAAAALWSGTQRIGWLVADNLIQQQPVSKPQMEIFALYALTIGTLLGRKQIQAALRASEARYRLLADNITDMVVCYNAAGEFSYVSPSSRTLLGYAPEALLGQSGFALVHPEDLAALQHLYTKVLEHAIPAAAITCRLRHQAGHYLWLEFAAHIIVGEATGEVLEIIVSARDVTQRRQAEDALRLKAEEEHTFQTYLKALHEITIELTLIDTLDDFYQRIVALGLERLGFERLGLLLYDPEHTLIRGTYGTDAQGQVVAEHHLQFAPGSLTGILQRTLCRSERFAFDEHTQLFSHFEPIGFGWNAAAVLWNGQQSLGCLAIDNGVHHKPVSKPLLDILALYSLTIGTLLARKQSDAALRESEEKFRLLLEAAPIATVISNQTGQIMLVNDQAERLFGYHRNELVGQAVEILVPAYARHRHAQNRATYIATPRVRQMGIGLELFALRKDGSEFPVEIELSYIETKAGLLVMSFVLDITERKQSAAALEEQRTFLREVIDVSPSMIFVKDYDARFVLANPIVAQMYNTSVEALLGKRDADFNPDLQEVADFLAADRRVIESGEPLFIEEPVTSLSGETHWLQTTKVPIISADGRSKYVLGVATDITARKNAEEALRQNEALLRTVLENLPVGVWITDAAGVIMQSNRAGQAIWAGVKYVGPEAYNEYKAWWADTGQRLTLGEWAAARAITHGETALNQELEIEAFDGTHKYILNSAIPILDLQQTIQGAILVNQDITERKQNEKRIRQALEKEKELSELKSRFVSMASHEFRTPLASILALTETLRAYRQRLTDEQIELRLGKIQEQVGHLKDIMEDVLQLARLQARRTEFNPTPCNLDGLCRSILDEFQSQSDVTHQLLYTCNDALRAVVLDKKLMRQLINNLVSNAIKYSHADTTIRVNLFYADETLVLTVRDEGIGIPAADLNHLFEPFHRAVNVGTISGTGLGLVIAKEAIELHSGTIRVESQLGVETIFTVSIPIGAIGAKDHDENPGD